MDAAFAVVEVAVVEDAVVEDAVAVVEDAIVVADKASSDCEDDERGRVNTGDKDWSRG